MINKAKDTVLRVRPVILGLEHLYYYEGPCRFGQGEALQPGYDRLANAQKAKTYVDSLRAHLPAGCELLDPVCISRTDNWDNAEAQWRAVAPAIRDCDVLAVRTGLGVNDLTIELADRFDDKVIAFAPNTLGGIADTAALLARPLKRYRAYPHIDWEHFAARLSALRAAKAIRGTSILCVTRFGSAASYGAVDSFGSYDLITSRLGVRFRFLNAHELLDQMTPAQPGGNHTTPGRDTPDLTEEDMQTVLRLADELTAGASELHVDRQYLINSLIAYVTVRKNLDLKDCNGFAVPCPDVCSTRRLNEMKFTFCLTHSLLMEEGIPSGCEFDVALTLSEQALMAVSGRSTYMGNSHPIPLIDGKLSLANTSEEELAKLYENPQNLYAVRHSVAHRRLADPEKSNPYALRHFAKDQKFGAIFRYDFNADAGKTVTVCRFSPDGSKLFIGRGTIVAGAGYRTDNCNNPVIFRVADQRDFFEKHCQTGMHLALVYGDYTRALTELANVLGVEALVSV